MKKLIPTLVIFLIFCVACSTEAVQPTPDVAAIYTTVAMTIIAGRPTAIPIPTNTPGPTATSVPTQPPTPSGQLRSDPLPGSKGVDIGGDMRLTLLGITRPANDKVVSGNMFNPTPSPDLEYAIVQMRVECSKSQNDKCEFFTSEIKSVGSDGQVHDNEAFVAGVPGLLDKFDYQFFGGSKIEGGLLFLFPKNDNQVVLFHEAALFGTPVYIALQ